MAKNSFLTEVTFKHVLNKKGKICPVTDCRVMEYTLCKDYSKQSQKSNRTFLSKVFKSTDSLFRRKKDIPLPPTAPPYAPRPMTKEARKVDFTILTRHHMITCLLPHEILSLIHLQLFRKGPTQ